MKADYHVHYYIDGCAADEMTFPNIEKKALELGLDEISVLKHHSRRMPNGEAVWVCWKRVKARTAKSTSATRRPPRSIWSRSPCITCPTSTG